MFIVFPAVLFVKSYTPDSSFGNPFLKFQGLHEYFFYYKTAIYPQVTVQRLAGLRRTDSED